MLDAVLRPVVDRLTMPVAGVLARQGIGANAVSIGGAVLGLAGAVAIAVGAPLAGLALFILGRISDGLDGAVARASGTGPTDWGGYLDIVLDFLVYAAIPLAFAVNDPKANGAAAAFLLAGFLANGSAFLGFATIAAKRGLSTTAQGKKSIYYLAGLAEGTETIVAFTAMCLWPGSFAAIATGFAVLCLVSAAARIVAARQLLT